MQIDNIDYFNFSNIFSDKMFAVLTKKTNQATFNADKFIKSKQIANPIQMHSNKVRFINNPGTYPNVDGLVTMNKNIILSLTR